MKFGESLREGLVPEWREQYLDYKTGKEIINKCRDLRDEVANEGATSRSASTDQTPLLEPVSTIERSTTYVPQDLDIGLPKTTKKTEGSGRKGSIFSLSRSNKSKAAEFDLEQTKFTTWLDGQLAKINHFYQEKEQDAYERFLLIEDQLYLLRDHKNYLAKKPSKPKPTNEAEKVKKKVSNMAAFPRRIMDYLNNYELPSLPSTVFLDKFKTGTKAAENIPMEYDPNYIENRIRNGVDTIVEEDSNDETSIESHEDEHHHIRAMISGQHAHEETPEQQEQTRRRDYTVKQPKFGVPYVVAKKQLRINVLEHYRALSLLKSYRVLNRTAFKKITKKFDKCVNSKISKAYVQKIDESAYFQTSDLLEKLIFHVEELFISFFDSDSTDRKSSLEKLRSIAYAMNNSDIRQDEYYGAFGSALFFFGFGVPLFVLTLYVALHKTLTGEMPEGKFLLQIWGGFFLIVLLATLVGYNLYVFDVCKINYKFIFEFDLATALDWRQYWFMPSVGFVLLCILAWFSFNDFWRNQFPGRDWPWIYLGLALGLFLWPGRQFFPLSRRWLQVALWRLLLSGFYPVEFRDFFLGDILCSLTYSMGNVSFFFCLYSHHWGGILNKEPSPERDNVCGSSKSRLMGFFSALPSIFRFLQCLRRYMDTGDSFPHLANMLKFALSTLYYCLLSVYRIDRVTLNKVIFIIVGILNSLYSTTWDLLMDWSLLQPGSRNPYLRDNLFYKDKWVYYAAMIANVILRFQWIWYACFNDQIEQLAVTSFWIAFAEIIRRFIWIFFRMENEHATNVTLFRASRDSPLPYAISPRVERAIKQLVKLRYVDKDKHEVDEASSQESEEAGTSTTTAYRPPYSQISRARAYSGSGDNELTRTFSRASRMSRDSMGKSPLKKSTLLNISDTLTKAHIKDFQRRKTIISQDSDDDDEEDFPDILPSAVYRLHSR